MHYLPSHSIQEAAVAYHACQFNSFEFESPYGRYILQGHPKKIWEILIPLFSELIYLMIKDYPDFGTIEIYISGDISLWTQKCI